MDFKTQLVMFEGREHVAYPDPLSPLAKAKQRRWPTAGLSGAPWTIGIGHTGPEVHPGLVWTDAQIDAAFDADVALARARCLNRMPWFETLSEPREAVVLGMVFQLGLNGVLKFVNTMACIRAGQYSRAANGMRASLWATQTPARANCLARQMETGEWQLPG